MVGHGRLGCQPRFAIRALLGVAVMLGLPGLAACGARRGSEDRAPRCPPASGEFPPHACAIVRARAVDREGGPIPSLGVRVDTYVRERGYAYTSGGALTDAQGRFELVVLRVNEFVPRTTPDTATVEIKAVPGRLPVPGFSPAARALVRMRFAPLGARVEPTAGDIVFLIR